MPTRRNPHRSGSRGRGLPQERPDPGALRPSRGRGRAAAVAYSQEVVENRTALIPAHLLTTFILLLSSSSSSCRYRRRHLM
ncbi:hypothetical protein B296_00021769 [Ensete ventricosum]|uniref:Uncharacterized protein n=1 Tax=Ensete ventricosum TaxID=4639 RepID=A0A427AM12_ENSVE|nr:hypothetical protein B296_00021769 [Ensete ventricosum]